MTTERKSKLPVNVREISKKQHVILRLEIIQRNILEDPARFDTEGDDPKLSHVKKEIQRLKKHLLKYIKEQAQSELLLLQRSSLLLNQWDSEKDLSDILMLDRQQIDDFEKKLIKSKAYLVFANMITEIQTYRERMYQKYEGYFVSQQDEIDEKKVLAQKSIQKCLPLANEARKHIDAISEVRTEIFALNQTAMKALATGFGILMASGLLGWWALGFWGAAGGFFLGYMAFTNLVHQFAYVNGKNIQGLHDFLMDRYARKTIRAFFRYENPDDTETPTAFDASRGEYLMRYLTKDVQKYTRDFNKQEKKREDTINYISYLEGRKQWLREQASKIQAQQMMRAEALLSPTFEAELDRPTDAPVPIPDPEEVIAFETGQASAAKEKAETESTVKQEPEQEPTAELETIPEPQAEKTPAPKPTETKEDFAKIPDMAPPKPKEEPVGKGILPQPRHETIRAPKKQKSSVTIVRKINQPPPQVPLPEPQAQPKEETYEEPFVIADDPIHSRKPKIGTRLSSFFQRKEKNKSDENSSIEAS